MGKLIVISAPSGAGKTSIVHHLLKEIPNLSFSVSACSRGKRAKEIDGKDYHFLGVNGFKKKIEDNAFLEWEEVYENQFYGTLKSEVGRIWDEGKTVIFDVDVVGGLNIKKQYPKECLSVFIMPPSIDVLKEIRKAVRNKIIIFDGGIRTGSDILKAISLGANIVSIGRPSLCGLIVNGSKGVNKTFELFKEEFISTMGLCGCKSINEINYKIIKNN